MSSAVFLGSAWWFLSVDVVLLVVVLVVVSILVVKVGRLVLLMKQNERAFKDFDCPPPHWFFGHMLTLMGSVHGLAAQGPAATKYGNYKLWLGPCICVLSLGDPDSIRVLSSTTEPKHELNYDIVRPWLGDGLVLSKGKKWFRNRRLLTPGFHFDILKPYVDIFQESTQVMLDMWTSMDHTKSFEISENVSRMTLDSLLKCVCSYESNCQTAGNDEYVQTVCLLTNMFVKRLRFPPYLSDTVFNNSYDGYKFKKACDFVHEKANHVIEERRKQIKQEHHGNLDDRHKRRYLDFLDILLNAKDEDGNGLTDTEIRDEVDTFMFAGHDTTASGISWCLYNLARHPEYQQKCRQEIDELMDSKENKILKWDDLSMMPYTTKCIKESLRLHPPVPWVSRKLTKPLILPDGRRIPGGHAVGINIFACHHNANVWLDPEVYDPERFSPENTKDRSSHAFIPFAAGPRNCIGQNFAMNELKICVAMTLHRYILSVDVKRPARQETRLTLKSKDGIHLYIKSRKL
ncbi:cytochrome P450 4F4-like [Glandiceps talaboti]